jgi:hypothetical protein
MPQNELILSKSVTIKKKSYFGKRTTFNNHQEHKPTLMGMKLHVRMLRVTINYENITIKIT